MDSRHLISDRRGATIVEFGLSLPLLITLLLGVLGYGQYFLLAHTAQQLANDAARATVAGTSTGERSAIADAVMARELARLPEIKQGTAALAVEEAGDLVTVKVRIDASRIALFRMPIVPTPDAVIVRQAVARQGGVL